MRNTPRAFVSQCNLCRHEGHMLIVVVFGQVGFGAFSVGVVNHHSLHFSFLLLVYSPVSLLFENVLLPYRGY